MESYTKWSTKKTFYNWIWLISLCFWVYFMYKEKYNPVKEKKLIKINFSFQ